MYEKQWAIQEEEETSFTQSNSPLYRDLLWLDRSCRPQPVGLEESLVPCDT